MAEENINGKMEWYFREIFGSTKEKEKEYFSTQTIRELKDIGEMMLEMNNPFTTNPHKQKFHIKRDNCSIYCTFIR
jgi:hypothetical protein